MSKYVVVISPCQDSFLWTSGDWIYQVSGNVADDIVIFDNDIMDGLHEAYWYDIIYKVLSAYEDARDYEFSDFRNECPDDIDEIKLRDIWDEFEYNEWPYVDLDDPEEYTWIGEILIPGLHLDTMTIHGYSQGDRATILYDTSTDVNLSELEDWVFGNVYNVDLYELDEEAVADADVDFDDLDARDVYRYGESMGIGNIMAYSVIDEDDFADLFNVPAEDIVVVIYE